MPDQPRIADLEAALDREQDIEILPDGTVVIREALAAEPKPLTFRQDLGGEY